MTRSAWLPSAASAAGLAALTAWICAPLLPCLADCLVDYRTLRGGSLGAVELADARLNAWILAWDHHALRSQPAALFDANIYYPARNALAASEHLLGIALPLWPVGLAGGGAVLVHQLAVIGSFLVLGLTTFGLVRWITGSPSAAFLAGVAALLMPWRYSELSHVQLLSAHWFPWVWLLVARILYGDRVRAAGLGLAAVASLQVLSSFYLAYFLLLSCALLGGVLALCWGLRRDACIALALAALPPGLLLAASARPYLAWRHSTGFEPISGLFDSVPLADALRLVGPGLPPTAYPFPVSYALPLAVFGLALLALWPGRGDAARRARGLGLGLGLASAVAWVLVLGRELSWGESTFPLPARWLAAWIPGFENLRSPLRWAIVPGMAFPVLAGIGAWRLAAGLSAWVERRSGGHRAVVPACTLALAAAVLASSPTAQLPREPAWPDPGAQAAYAALARLPEGPVLEIPWPLAHSRNLDLASRYMLGSTLHWRPLLNGTSGYYPRSWNLIAELARRLPSQQALAQLRRVVDLRWIVVHRDGLSREERVAWADAARRGALRVGPARGGVQIFELEPAPGDGAWMERLLDEGPRARSFAGLPRTPLRLSAESGRLEAEIPRTFFFRGANRFPRLVPLRIHNHTALAWPGFDVDPEGLLRLRYSFRANGRELPAESAPLIVDVPPESSLSTTASVRPPARGGRYRLVLDLVQQLDGELRELPLAPVEAVVEVAEAQLAGAP